MVSKNWHYAMVLHQLIKRICNGSTSVVVEDFLGNIIEALCNFTLIQGDEYDTLPNHIEAYQNRFKVLKMAGFDMATLELRDIYVDELRSRKRDSSELYEKIKT